MLNPVRSAKKFGEYPSFDQIAKHLLELPDSVFKKARKPLAEPAGLDDDVETRVRVLAEHLAVGDGGLRMLAGGVAELACVAAFGIIRAADEGAELAGDLHRQAALAAFGLPLPATKPSSASIGLKWDARNDRIKIANNLVRVYRLEAGLFDRYKVVLYVSPVGEILRLELPDEIVLTNDALTNL